MRFAICVFWYAPFTHFLIDERPSSTIDANLKSHLHKKIIFMFVPPWFLLCLSYSDDLWPDEGTTLDKENTKTRPMTWNRNVDLMKYDLFYVFYVQFAENYIRSFDVNIIYASLCPEIDRSQLYYLRRSHYEHSGQKYNEMYIDKILTCKWFMHIMYVS